MARFLRQGIILTLLACFGGMMYLNAILLAANQRRIDESSFEDKLRKTEISRLINTNFNPQDKTDLDLSEWERQQKEMQDQQLLTEEEIERQRILLHGTAKNPLIRSKIDGEHFSIDYLVRDPSLFSETYDKPKLNSWKSDSCQGKWTIYRDYTTDPVVYGKSENDNIKCDIPCVRAHGQPQPDIPLGRSTKGCPHMKHAYTTMENTDLGTGIGHLREIKGTTSLKSDVPLQYFNWDEFDFMKPPLNKTADGLVAAFISNCGPKYRLEYMQALMDNGVVVHSYGKCLTNKEEPLDQVDKRHRSKLELGGTYKFIFSFENSETEDYISEKVFEAIEAGVVPIYHGGPNPQRFAPANKSIIFADEYQSPVEMATLLKQLDADDNKYNEYLKWKEEGPSKDFIAMIDLGIVHSDCRFCIRSADIDRVVVGEVVTGPYQQQNEDELKKFKNSDALLLKVRKRGKFWLKYIHLTELTVTELTKRILEKFPDLGNIYKIYELWNRSKTAITTNEQVEKLLYGHELEVIFEEPLSKERGRYSQWYYKKHGLELLP